MEIRLNQIHTSIIAADEALAAGRVERIGTTGEGTIGRAQLLALVVIGYV